MEFFLAANRAGVRPTRLVLVVGVAQQSLWLFEKSCAAPRNCPAQSGSAAVARNRYHTFKTFRCSTSRFGVGQDQGSNRTPLGLHRVAEKTGGGRPVGTVFKSRQAVGFTWQGLPKATITTRILWLEGLEPGFNRGGGVDSRARYIYIHGTGDESGLGRPASCGCIHLGADDLMPLFDGIPAGTLVWIAPG